MPSKIQLDENLWFLYICLQKSDLKSIDFAAVGHATNLKPPAARMRYTRLRRQIESGTLIGTHGTRFLSFPSTPHPPSPTISLSFGSNKRKRLDGGGNSEDEEEIGMKGRKNENGEWSKNFKKVEDKEKDVKKEGTVKLEDGECTGFDSWSGTESEGESEDEVPLAKLRKAKLSVPGNSVDRQDMVTIQNGGNYACSGGYQGMREGAAVPSYMPMSEGRAWEGMIPVGNVGIDRMEAGYPAYWGNGFSGVGAWDQGLLGRSGKPRKSV